MARESLARPPSMRLSVALLTCLVAVPLHAHDFWIEPSSFTPAPGQTFTIGLRVGQDFVGDPIPRSASLIETFTMRDANGDRAISGVENRDPAGYARLNQPGIAVIAYRSKPYPLELTAAKYQEFLDLEGFTGIRAQPGPHREQFSRFAKAIVGRGGNASVWTKPFGWRFEIVPESNPAEASPLLARVVLDGRPAAAALVTAIFRDDAGTRLSARTDRHGRVTLTLPRKGVWLIKCVALVAAKEGSAFDTETLWASLTFER